MMRDWWPDDHGAGRHLLLVDDELSIRGLMKCLLETEGFDVTDAGSSTEALRVLSGVDIDLLITDIQMPVMNGLELAQAVRADRPEMSILLMSGPTPADCRDFMDAHCLFLEKPFSTAHLVTKVRQALAVELPTIP